MNYLARKPITEADRLRRGIAVVLDAALIFSRHTDNGVPLFRLGLGTWDNLVDAIVAVVERQEFERKLAVAAKKEVQ